MMISNNKLKALMINVIDYIKETEVKIDGEWGDCRTFKELLKHDLIPDIYYDCMEILNTIKAIETMKDK